MKHSVSINGVTIEAGGPRAPILRARRDWRDDNAITHEAIGHAVLACGSCDRAIEGWRSEEMHNWVGRLHAVPCGCEVVDVPVWARNPKASRRRG